MAHYWRMVVGLVLLVFVSVGCDSDPLDGDPSSCLTVGPDIEIVDNHLPSGGDHALVVTAEDVMDADLRTYDIRGDNVGHTHSVTVTTADFMSLQRGEAVSIVSSNNGTVGIGHDHTVRMSCP